MWKAWEKRENCTRFLWESPRERDHSEDRGVNGRKGSEWILERLAGGAESIQLVLIENELLCPILVNLNPQLTTLLLYDAAYLIVFFHLHMFLPSGVFLCDLQPLNTKIRITPILCLETMKT
jgi:hypothetical protein